MIAAKEEINKNFLPKTQTLDSLPKDVFERCLSFLDTKDLCITVDPVCRSFRDVLRTSRVWEAIALRTYGAEILQEARSAYTSCRHMVADDMRLVAVPTISMVENPIPSCWIFNRVHRFYLCLVLCIRYHRNTNEIRIYFEARGEWDLRHPKSCSITRQRDFQISKTTGFQGVSHGRGHYRGYVSFDAAFFDRQGTYTFLYADPRISDRFFPPDYEPIPIQFGGFGGDVLKHTFSINQRFDDGLGQRLYTLSDWSPFCSADDRLALDRLDLERFRPFVDYRVWSRHRPIIEGGQKWWVERGKRGGDRSSVGDSDVYTDFVKDFFAQHLFDQED